VTRGGKKVRPQSMLLPFEIRRAVGGGLRSTAAATQFFKSCPIRLPGHAPFRSIAPGAWRVLRGEEGGGGHSPRNSKCLSSEVRGAQFSPSQSPPEPSKAIVLISYSGIPRHCLVWFRLGPAGRCCKLFLRGKQCRPHPFVATRLIGPV
jgi:hypothetical protein